MNQINSFFKPLGSKATRSSPRKAKAKAAATATAANDKAIVSGKGEKRSHKTALATTESKITPPRKRRHSSRKTSKGSAKGGSKAITIDEDDDDDDDDDDDGGDDDFVMNENDVDDDDEDFEMEDESEKTTPVKRQTTPVKKQTRRRTKRAIVIDDDDDDDDDDDGRDKQPAVTKTRAKADTNTSRKNKSENSPRKSAAGSKGKPAKPQSPLKESSHATDKPRRRSSIGTASENKDQGQKSESSKEEFIKDCKEVSNDDPDWEFAVPDEGSSCLVDVTIVFTGELENMPERPEVEDLVKRHGGRVTSAVSGKTTLLVQGDNPGKVKTQKAESLGTIILNEQGFFRLVMKRYQRLSKGKSNASKKPLESQAVEPKAKSEKEKVPQNKPLDKQQQEQQNSLWTVKYAPKSIGDIVANTKNVETLLSWLKSWRSNYKSLNSADFRKAVLLSGPPGVGKTSSAILACKQLGMTAMQVNASDARNKAQKDIKGGIGGKTANIIKEYVTNRVLSGSSEVVLIMDEVDGMSAGDRGGVADLIQTIKTSKIPIICIANDKYSQKLRSLLNHVMALDYRKPTKDQVARRVEKIASQEGLKTGPNAIQQLAEECNGDIRLVLNSLQIYCTNHNQITYDDIKGGKGAAPQKDLAMSVFNAMDAILSSRQRGSVAQKLDLVFHDMDLIPLMYQENYLNFANEKNGPDSVESMAFASNAISAGDIINSKVRGQQAWGLMPFAAFMSVVLGTHKCSGFRESMFPQDFRNRFPSWLGKNSTASKNRRLISQIQLHALASSSHLRASSKDLRLVMWKLLQKKLTRPLQMGADGIDEVIATMQDFGLDREDWGIICEELGFCGIPKKDRPAIETKVKSAFSRQKASNTRVSEPVGADNDVVAQEEAVADEENEDEDEDEDMPKAKSKQAGTGKGSGSGRGGGARATKSKGKAQKGGRGR